MRGRWVVAVACFAVCGTVCQGGFEWGSGCESGAGEFKQKLEPAGATVTVGAIPKGKWNVKILLTADSDVDVQLFDKSAGKALVAWCDRDAEPTCDLGIVSGPSAEEFKYNDMSIQYSGYEGVDQNPGKESIVIKGLSNSELEMRAFAYKAGTALIEYSWDREQTPCCLGLEPCGGSFDTEVAKGQVKVLGEIPTEKKNVRIELSAPTDIDIQLFDQEATREFSEGKAIIAYCESNGCNKGALGNNDGSPESTSYKSLLYQYSGYNGDVGTNKVNPSLGNEYINITGLSNTRLQMRAFGYASGKCKVTYSYFEDYLAPVGGAVPSVDWLVASNAKEHKTELYYDVPERTLILRRGVPFRFLVTHPDGIKPEQVQLVLQECASMFVNAPDDCTDSTSPETIASFQQNQQDSAVLVIAELPLAGPVGRYRLIVRVPAFSLESRADLVILFNPYKYGEAVYASSSDRTEYNENTEALIWQGLSDNNNGFRWNLDQFRFSNLQVALDSIRRMPVQDRQDPALVARHLTYAIGADICYGKWGEGSYTKGTFGYTCDQSSSWNLQDVVVKKKAKCFPPDYWTGTTELLDLYRKIRMPVQFCQCFVYAGVTATLGRALGLPTRIVSNFQSAHDTEANRAIEKYYTLTKDGIMDPRKDGPSTDSIWSFHVWNEVYMKRNEVNKQLECKSCANGWQVIDSTPQELSAGGSGTTGAQYQLGPVPVKLVRSNKVPELFAVDAEFVIGEVNANLNLWTTDQTTASNGPILWKLYTSSLEDPWQDKFATIGQQISTKAKGPISQACLQSFEDGKDCSEDRADLTRYYKYSEPSGPGNPLDRTAGPCHVKEPPTCASSGRRERRRNLLRLGRLLSDDASPQDNGVFAQMGVWPSATEPIVNMPGHIASSLAVSLGVSNMGASPRTVRCHFVASAVDYSGVFVTRLVQRNVTLTVGLNETQNADFEITRGDYRALARTYLDVAQGQWAEGLAEMDESEKLFKIRIEAVLSDASSGGLLLSETHEAILCTPRVGAGQLRSGRIMCEGNRGQYFPPRALVDAFQHLSRDACSEAGVSTLVVNDGRCQPSKNVVGCWDGGDCCKASCLFFNGGLITSEDSGSWIPAHECLSLDDDSSCMDPLVRDFVRVYESASLAVISNATEADDDVQDCSLTTVEVVQRANLPSASYKQVLCEDLEFPLAIVECKTDLEEALAPVALPRCSARTKHGCRCASQWTFMEPGSALLGSYESHACANPQGHSYEFYPNNWCQIVPNSCVDVSFDTSAHSQPAFCECASATSCPRFQADCAACPRISNRQECESASRIWREETFWDDCSRIGAFESVEQATSSWNTSDIEEVTPALDSVTREWTLMDEYSSTNGPTPSPAGDKYLWAIITIQVKVLLADSLKPDVLQVALANALRSIMELPVQAELGSTVQVSDQLDKDGAVIGSANKYTFEVRADELEGKPIEAELLEESRIREALKETCGRSCTSFEPQEFQIDVQTTDTVSPEPTEEDEGNLDIILGISIPFGVFILSGSYFLLRGKTVPTEDSSTAIAAHSS